MAQSWPGWLLALISCASVLLLGGIFALIGKVLRHYDIIAGSGALLTPLTPHRFAYPS